MKIPKIFLTVILLSLVAALSLSCRSAPDTESEYQTATVQRGDLTIDVISSGNLAFSHQEELAFEVSGTVDEVLVEVGDSVAEGQVLAKFDDTSTVSLEKAVIQAKINLENAESTELEIVQAEAAAANARVALEAAEKALEKAENPYTETDIVQAELAVINAEKALEGAENPYTETDIVQAELAVINAEIALDNAQQSFERAEERYLSNRSVTQWAQDYEIKQRQLSIAEFDLAEAEETLVEMKAGADPLQVAIAEFDLADAEEALDEMAAGADPLEVEHKQKQLAVAQANLKEAEDDLAEILGSVDSLAVELRQSEVASAQAALDKAIEQLEKATMVAPFAGIVILVNIDPGDAVNANQVVIQMVDPDKFEADILVNEIDIFSIQQGAPATIEVDAISGISLPGTVTTISSMAIIQSGVVNYRVTVQLESFESLRSVLEPPAASQEEKQPQTTPGSLDEALDRAVAEGLISQEQADFMKERMPEQFANLSEEEIEQFIERFGQGFGQFGRSGEGFGGFTPRAGAGAGAGPGAGARQRPGSMMLEALQLREGLTVTVSIILQQRIDVLLVPNQAITLQGGNTFVQVIEDGVTVERPIITGLSDWQYTEVIEGLSQGEQVVVPQGTVTTPTTQQGQRRPGFGIPFFGGGGEEH